MFLLNLSWAGFLALWVAVWGVAIGLYLLDRSRRRVVVPTLQLWRVSELVSHLKRRRRIQQPWSLLLQLASMLLILAAAADFHWNSAAAGPRDHVILLDASAWMAARGQGGPLLDEAKAAAIAYVRAMPAADRAMIVYAGAVAAPATGFESDRKVLEQAIRGTRAGSTSLQLSGAIQFARDLLRAGRSPGEIVYAGAGRIPHQDAAPVSAQRLRVLPVSDPLDNCGLREISLRRAAADPEEWEISVAVRNYGRSPHTVPMVLQFAGALIGSHDFTLAAGQEQSVSFRYRSRSAGWVDARLLINDSLTGDNRARVEIPAQPVLEVLAYTRRPDLLRPILGASPNVRGIFADPRAYSPTTGTRIVILDGFVPSIPPSADTVWIDPPAGPSPFRVAAIVAHAKLERWHGESPLGAGLWAKDVQLASAQAFAAEPGDLAVADCAAGPVILARPGAHKAVVFGFNPMLEPVRSELSIPLVFANTLRWMAPDMFRQWDLHGGRVGPMTIPLDPGTDTATVRVRNEGGLSLPFSVGGGFVRFFTAEPGIVRVSAANRESTYSQTLLDVADAKWQPPENTLRGPGRSRASWPARETWPVLALAGLAGWIAEWLLFGRRRYVAVADLPGKRSA